MVEAGLLLLARSSSKQPPPDPPTASYCLYLSSRLAYNTFLFNSVVLPSGVNGGIAAGR